MENPKSKHTTQKPRKLRLKEREKEEKVGMKLKERPEERMFFENPGSEAVGCRRRAHTQAASGGIARVGKGGSWIGKLGFETHSPIEKCGEEFGRNGSNFNFHSLLGFATLCRRKIQSPIHERDEETR